jgi:hypothetical protein
VRSDKPIEDLMQVEVSARVTESAAVRLSPPDEH